VRFRPATDPGAPYLARFSRDVGLTNVDLKLLIGVKSLGVKAVESHISLKTSEMWGTQLPLTWKSLDRRHPQISASHPARLFQPKQRQQSRRNIPQRPALTQPVFSRVITHQNHRNGIRSM
jgi:hypothetical protein